MSRVSLGSNNLGSGHTLILSHALLRSFEASKRDRQFEVLATVSAGSHQGSTSVSQRVSSPLVKNASVSSIARSSLPKSPFVVGITDLNLWNCHIGVLIF